MRNLKSVLMTAALFVIATSASAQATRTWVSGVGDDANPCSRTAPCKTFAGAISKTATNGEISVLDPGGFGAVTITKSMTINGEGSLGGLLASGSSGIIINAATSSKVTLKSLIINGVGNSFSGIRILTAGSVVIDNVTLINIGSLTTHHGIDISPDADQVNPMEVTVANSLIRGSAGMGIFASATSAASEVRLMVENTNIVDGGQSGVDLDNFAKGVISRSTMTGHVGAGLFVERATCEAAVFSSILSRNGTGIDAGFAGGGTVRLFGSQVTQNTTSGINIAGAAIVSTHGNNAIIGNAGTQATNATANLQ